MIATECGPQTELPREGGDRLAFTAEFGPIDASPLLYLLFHVAGQCALGKMNKSSARGACRPHQFPHVFAVSAHVGRNKAGGSGDSDRIRHGGSLRAVSRGRPAQIMGVFRSHSDASLIS